MIAVICFINGVIVLVSLKSFTDTDKTRKLLRMVDPTISSMGHEARMKRENTDLGFLLQLAATDNLREKHPCFNLSMQAMKMARLEKVNVDDRTPYLRLLKSMIKWSVKQKSDEAFSDDKVKKLIANLAHGRNYWNKQKTIAQSFFDIFNDDFNDAGEFRMCHRRLNVI